MLTFKNPYCGKPSEEFLALLNLQITKENPFSISSVASDKNALVLNGPLTSFTNHMNGILAAKAILSEGARRAVILPSRTVTIHLHIDGFPFKCCLIYDENNPESLPILPKGRGNWQHALDVLFSQKVCRMTWVAKEMRTDFKPFYVALGYESADVLATLVKKHQTYLRQQRFRSKNGSATIKRSLQFGQDELNIITENDQLERKIEADAAKRQRLGTDKSFDTGGSGHGAPTVEGEVRASEKLVFIAQVASDPTGESAVTTAGDGADYSVVAASESVSLACAVLHVEGAVTGAAAAELIASTQGDEGHTVGSESAYDEGGHPNGRKAVFTDQHAGASDPTGVTGETAVTTAGDGADYSSAAASESVSLACAVMHVEGAVTGAAAAELIASTTSTQGVQGDEGHTVGSESAYDEGRGHPNGRKAVFTDQHAGASDPATGESVVTTAGDGADYSSAAATLAGATALLDIAGAEGEGPADVIESDCTALMCTSVSRVATDETAGKSATTEGEFSNAVNVDSGCTQEQAGEKISIGDGDAFDDEGQQGGHELRADLNSDNDDDHDEQQGEVQASESEDCDNEQVLQADEGLVEVEGDYGDDDNIGDDDGDGGNDAESGHPLPKKGQIFWMRLPNNHRTVIVIRDVRNDGESVQYMVRCHGPKFHRNGIMVVDASELLSQLSKIMIHSMRLSLLLVKEEVKKRKEYYKVKAKKSRDEARNRALGPVVGGSRSQLISRSSKKQDLVSVHKDSNEAACSGPREQMKDYSECLAFLYKQDQGDGRALAQVFECMTEAERSLALEHSGYIAYPAKFMAYLAEHGFSPSSIAALSLKLSEIAENTSLFTSYLVEGESISIETAGEQRRYVQLLDVGVQKLKDGGLLDERGMEQLDQVMNAVDKTGGDVWSFLPFLKCHYEISNPSLILNANPRGGHSLVDGSWHIDGPPGSNVYVVVIPTDTMHLDVVPGSHHIVRRYARTIPHTIAASKMYVEMLMLEKDAVKNFALSPTTENRVLLRRAEAEAAKAHGALQAAKDAEKVSREFFPLTFGRLHSVRFTLNAGEAFMMHSNTFHRSVKARVDLKGRVVPAPRLHLIVQPFGTKPDWNEDREPTAHPIDCLVPCVPSHAFSSRIIEPA